MSNNPFEHLTPKYSERSFRGVKVCKKCSQSAMQVHIMDRGLCQECEAEVSWKLGDKKIKENKLKQRRLKRRR